MRPIIRSVLEQHLAELIRLIRFGRASSTARNCRIKPYQ